MTYPESVNVAVVKFDPPSLLIEAIMSVLSVGVPMSSSNTTIREAVGTIPLVLKAFDTIVVDLAAVEEGYYEILSEASKISLKAQGGPFTKEEAEEFINKPFMKEAVELRRFDDQAKILNKETPNLEHFKHYLEDSLK